MLAFAGQLVGYLLSVVLARQLGVEEFQAYAVASAVFILMAMFAPRGSEKYALRLLPVLIEHGDWQHAHGYMRFGLRRTLLTSLLLAAVVAAWAWWVRDFSDATRLAIVVTALSLPAGALAHYGLEVLSAWGRELHALTLFRVAVPTMALATVAILLLSPIHMDGAMAIACWGIAWMLVLALMALDIRRVVPTDLVRTTPLENAAAWNAASHPFFIYRISLAVLGQSGIIALDWLQPSATTTGAYVAAASTAGLAAVLATATNRAYARQLAVLLEHGQYATVLALRRKRLRWLIPVLAMFVLISFMFTREVLELFRPEFVEEGIVPLRVLAMATAFTVLFALAPTYLKYTGQNRKTYLTVACAAAAQVLLLVLLVPGLGATGAAIAYAVSMCGMYAVFAWMARSELLRLRNAN